MPGRHTPPPAPNEWHGEAQTQYEADIADGVPWSTAWDWAVAENARLELVAADACAFALPADYSDLHTDGEW